MLQSLPINMKPGVAMGFVSLMTARYAEMVSFYRDRLGGRVERAWERPGARGMLLDMGGLRVELMDATAERKQPVLEKTKNGIHLVIEVAGLRGLAATMRLPEPAPTSWGAIVVTLADPDGLPVSLLEWTVPPPGAPNQS